MIFSTYIYLLIHILFCKIPIYETFFFIDYRTYFHSAGGFRENGGFWGSVNVFRFFLGNFLLADGWGGQLRGGSLTASTSAIATFHPLCGFCRAEGAVSPGTAETSQRVRHRRQRQRSRKIPGLTACPEAP